MNIDLDIARGDPILGFLRDKVGVSTVFRAVLFGWLLRAVSIFLLPWLVGLLDVALKDVPSLIMSVITFPTVAAFYISQSSMVEEVAEGLLETKIVAMEGEWKRVYAQRLKRWLAWRLWFWLVFAGVSLGLILHAYMVVSHAAPALYWYYSPLHPIVFFLYNLPMMWLFVYMGAMFVVKQVVVISWLFGLLKNARLNLYVLHPDKCGGIAFLGRFSLRNSYFLGVLGLNFGLLSLAVSHLYHVPPFSQPDFVLVVCAFFVAVPLLFLLPLLPAHNGMKSAKEDTLRKISEVADSLYDEIQNQITANGEISREYLRRLDDLRKVYNIAQSFPVWPFDVGTLKHLVAITISPFLPSLIEWMGLVAYRTLISVMK